MKRRRALLGHRLVHCLFAAVALPGLAQAIDFDSQRVSGLDFESITAAEAFSRIATQAGMGVTLDGCPPAGTRVSAKAVSGRLPVVLDRLTAALGCNWRERAGVLYIHGTAPAQAQAAPSAKPADAPSTPVLAQTVKQPEQQDEKAKVAMKDVPPEPVAPSISFRLGSTDIATYALRDFLLDHGMSLVWGAGDVASVTTVPGEYAGDTPLAAVDSLLRAHGLRGVYVRSNKTLYVR